MISKNIFNVVNSNIQKNIRYPSLNSSSYDFQKYDCRVNLDRYLPMRLRISGVMIWIIIPNKEKIENKVSKSVDNSDMFDKNSIKQAASNRMQSINSLYKDLVIVFKTKYAAIPEKRKSNGIIQIINFSVYTFKLLTAHLTQFPTVILVLFTDALNFDVIIATRRELK